MKQMDYPHHSEPQMIKRIGRMMMRRWGNKNNAKQDGECPHAMYQHIRTQLMTYFPRTDYFTTGS